VYILKSYIESYEFKDISDRTAILLEKRGYKPYKYQLDAVNLALSIIEKYNGVILSDVVGLGKTIISCLIANRLQKKGIVICPPNLIGDDNKKSGWKKYLEEFDLYDWDVKSSGDLKKAYEFVSERNDIKVVIVDEAHRFRNEDTSTYECLKNICRGKIVLLLSATPFNNKPSDIFALLKLFTIPRQSNLALDDDIEAKFITYKNLFKDLSYITRYYNSNDSEKRKRAKSLYRKRFMSESINISLVKRKVHEIASEIRAVIEPVVIRRNRIDLMNNPEYKDEVKELPKVKDPEQWFYELTEEQSKFYDDILQKFFAEPEEGGKFTGAIYRPFFYEEGIFSPEEIADKIQLNKVNQLEESIDEGEKINRELMQQQNLYNFMRRLLVKRFESSFGAFYKSLINFKNIHEKALNFIIKTGKGDPLNGKYYLIRNLIDTVNELNDENYEEIEEKITEYENEFLEKF
ncbi:MAG: SNF2-related protein, partial [Spirochaetota bacterium]